MSKIIKYLLAIVLSITIIAPIQVENVLAIDPNSLVINVSCGDGYYSVDRITGYNQFTNLACYPENQFTTALTAMYTAAAQSPNVVVRNNASNSPLNIVAADRAMAYSQNYTYLSASTMNVYDDKALTDPYTYVNQSNPFYYYATEVKSKSSTETITPSDLVVNVEVNGAKGYVPLNGVDIIPLIYVENRDNNWYITFTTRTVNLSTGASVYTGNVIKPNITYYQVYSQNITTINGTVSKRVVNAHVDFATIAANYEIGLAPSWLADGTYYSADGVHFFTDMDLGNPVMNGSSVGLYYNYYQYLNLRSKTNYTGTELDAYFTYFANLNPTYLNKDIQISAMKNQGTSFINAQNAYGMNALLIYSMAVHESGYGVSTYATDYNNLFGYGAYDSNPDNAINYSYPSVADGVNQQMGLNLRTYLDYSNYSTTTLNSLFYASNIGSKGAGINTRYASDPFWSIKIASWAFKIDRYLGFKDFDHYQLGILSDSARTVYKNSQLTTTAYSVDQRATDYPYVIHSSYNNTYYTYSTNPIADDGSLITSTTPGVVPYNWNNSTVYIGTTQTTLANTAPDNVTIINGTDNLLLYVTNWEWSDTSIYVKGWAALENTNMNYLTTTHTLNILDMRDDSIVNSLNLSIATENYELALNNSFDYSKAWFEGTIPITTLSTGNYLFQIVTESGDTKGITLLSNSTINAPRADTRTIENKYYRSTFNNTRSMRYELLIETGIEVLDYTPLLPTRFNSTAYFTNISFSANSDTTAELMSLTGISFIQNASTGINDNVSHQLLLVDNAGNDYTYPLTTSTGSYDLSNNNIDYSYAWFRAENLDVSLIPNGEYSIYVITTTSTYKDIVELRDLLIKNTQSFTVTPNVYELKLYSTIRRKYTLIFS